MPDMTNIPNPMNARDDLEERNQPHTTQLPAQAEADDLFDDTIANQPSEKEEPDDRPGHKSSCGTAGDE